MRISRRQFIGLSLLGAAGIHHEASAGLLEKTGLFGKKEKAPFTFAAINDTHILDARSTAIVSRAVNQINADPAIQFTVVLGDLATAGTLTELNLAKRTLDRLERPCFAVPGNHDVAPRGAGSLANYCQAFGNPLWREEEEGWVFLGLDSCEGTKSDVSIQPGRIQWLERQLRHIKRKRPIALFAHHPFNPNTKKYRVKNADEVLAMFAGYNLKLVACGHWHGNQVEEQDGILFTTTACCSSTRDNFDGTEEKGYRLFRLEGDSVTTEFVPVAL